MANTATTETVHRWDDQYVHADLHDATKAKLAKAVEALLALEVAGGLFSEKPVLASNSDMIRAVNEIRIATFRARAVLAEIEKGGV
jgi:hypothetical protein